jgi:hypothetical protein
MFFADGADFIAFLVYIVGLYSLDMVTATSDYCAQFRNNTIMYDWVQLEHSAFLFSLIGVPSFTLIYKVASLLNSNSKNDDEFRVDCLNLHLKREDRQCWYRAESLVTRSNDFMDVHKNKYNQWLTSFVNFCMCLYLYRSAMTHGVGKSAASEFAAFLNLAACAC